MRLGPDPRSIASSLDVRGRDAIEAGFRRLKKGIIRTLELTPIELEVYGDRAYELSVFYEVLEIPGKPTIEDRGRAMFVWQREPDGAWRIRRLLVNDGNVGKSIHSPIQDREDDAAKPPDSVRLSLRPPRRW